jgi:hypothetical protein
MMHSSLANRKAAFCLNILFSTCLMRRQISKTRRQRSHIEHIVVRSQNKARNQSFSLGEKHALKICTDKNEVIMHPN